MISQARTLNSLWAALIVEELVRNGCVYFCISPGSRSTPLTLAAAENTRAHKRIFYDERGAAFHALGYGRARRMPAVLIATSGTAVANYLPAIIEASLDHVPLIVLTADRPPELRDTGANQTIDQIKIFGNYVRWFFDLPCPTGKIAPEMVLTTIDQACYRAVRGPAGPVHVNCQFREPLAPNQPEAVNGPGRSIAAWLKQEAPYTQYLHHEPQEKAGNSSGAWHAAIRDAKHGLVVVGRLRSEAERKAVHTFTQKLGWPVFPDITSGLRLTAGHPGLVHYYDQLLLDDALTADLAPDLVLHLGGRFVSKRLLHFFQQQASLNYIHVAPFPERLDPGHLVKQRLEIGLENLLHLAEVTPADADQEWNRAILDADRTIGATLDAFFRQHKKVSEPGLARLVSQKLPCGHLLFLGNSMPIRDMDMYGAPGDTPPTIVTNRGASGIDGNIATAVGAAAGQRRPITSIVGDLALLHDLNSLSQLRDQDLQAIFIVINNRGGGIFSFLPVSAQKAHFEKYFATPHNFSFEAAASLFGLSYILPRTMDEFAAAYEESCASDRSALIEIRTSREQNFALHQSLQAEIRRALQA